MAFLGFDHLYLLNDPLTSRFFRGKLDCESDPFLLTRNEAELGTEYKITWAMGGHVPSQIIWTTSVFPLIVHESVIAILETNGFTGWTTYPTRVFSKIGEEKEGYRGLAIMGRSDRAVPMPNSIFLVKYPGGWFPRFKGEHFDPDSWDG